MAGLYIHIPFCRQACYYCDFHFSASLYNKTELLQALSTELSLRKDELQEPLETIYFGGGTPSVLHLKELEAILLEAGKLFKISDSPEITLEANPDDLTKDYLKGLKNIGFNRLSIGIQILDDRILKWMNRRHTGQEAVNSVINAAEAGFKNINVDIIYGIPGTTADDTRSSLKGMLDLPVHHLSAYHLGIEEKTVFGVRKKKGLIHEINEERSLEDYQVVLDMAAEKRMIHYEVSNFALEGYISRHNSAYWTGKKYLGIGPSAHSFDGCKRSWNVAVNADYIQALKKYELPSEFEILSKVNQLNDYLLTSLRTIWGIDILKISNEFGDKRATGILEKAQAFIEGKDLIFHDNHLIPTEKGLFRSDMIISALMVND